MKKLLRSLGIFFGSILLLLLIITSFIILSPQGKLNLPVIHRTSFSNPNLESFPSQLVVSNNQLINKNGEVIRLRGMMPSDPSVLHGRNLFNRGLFTGIHNRGANVVRIPVHPEHWRNNPEYLWRYLDRAVTWGGEAGLYVIIDWHSIGNVQTGSAPLMPELYSHTYEMTLEFWLKTATYFKDAPNVLFEIFNEPQGISSGTWRSSATEIISVIRSQGARQPIIVGGLEYARDLSWVLEDPLEDPNLVYAAHIYPGHSRFLWPQYFGKVAQTFPVLITEWGFMDENRQANSHYLAGNAETYGETFITYLDDLQIGWVACWYDDEWLPQMFTRRFESPTRFGTFVINQLQKN